ncbi:hypothetical protein A4G16_03080 [Mannheimia granulomatis]|uniref:DUF2877 domain-containing protein n=1 Tax=Mannheimia granulomatis TaxID=85402 RepID=A0A6G8JGW7_9PAST|nr:DUF2877 domain-containing protein [Mannheimia granulomatis]QIM66430.1 hypothetical protein A4G16_03080 [Mannheimia granulomatis]
MNIKEQIINISLSATSDYAQEFVGNMPIVYIHSIYKKAINLLIHNKLFALQPKGSYLSPVSLITDLSVAQFQQLSLFPQQYQLNLHYQNCAIFCSKLTACIPSEKSLLALYANIAQQILQQTNTLGFSQLLKSNFDDLILSSCQSYLYEVQHLYHNKDMCNAAHKLAKFIGLGIGLTPSGDDFLCGFLAVFQRMNLTKNVFYQTLTDQIQQNLDKTNLISARFLECALMQQFSVIVLDFLNLNESESINISHIQTQFEKIGHSSGMDTLFGIYYACELLSYSEK